jgi:Tfp pilus assembly protein PilN
MHEVNLLPQAATERLARKRTVLAWTQAVIAALLISGLFIVWGQSTATQYLTQIEQDLTQAAHPKRLRQQHAALTARLRSIKELEIRHQDLRSGYSPLVVIQLLHQLKDELGGNLQALAFDYTEQSTAATAGLNTASRNTAGPGMQGFISVQMVADGSATCSQLMQRLRATALFTDVKLSSSLEQFEQPSESLRFTLRCEF